LRKGDKSMTSHKKNEEMQKIIKKNQKEIKDLKNQMKQLNDKYFRTLADFQNFQKRSEKELLCNEEEIKKIYIIELIDLYELLKKALKDKNPKEGLKLLINNIEKFMEKERIKAINCIGQKFDHNLHHAITTIEKNECDDNIVIEEVKKGYILDDKLLRPSHVIVTKKKV
jgi:molecular chaperone GrpE